MGRLPKLSVFTPLEWPSEKGPSREDGGLRGAVSATFWPGLDKLPPSPLPEADSRSSPHSRRGGEPVKEGGAPVTLLHNP